ncbi:MAG TPA: glycosyltransferase family 4 protein [Candidatus Eisenbacteria bacterium]|jgi:glycosyltransferase involved in cell wall biosynthesis|nr:glycosyltransferase family 4 protein [Candidatus Eisenbacteria bacterium]
MKILFITQYFTPETEIGGIRILEIAARLQSMGHQIQILTGLPNYPSGKLFDGYRSKSWRGTWTETISGLRVTRVPLFPSHDKKTLPRLLNYFSFLLASATRALFLERPDVVVCTSPPLTIGLAAWCAAKRFRVPFLLEIRDLWPEAAIELGYLKNPLLQRAAYALESFLYARATKIVSVSEGMRADLLKRGIPASRCEVICNGVDVQLFASSGADCSSNELVDALKREGNIVGVYLGTISAYHGVDCMLDLLERLQRESRIKIVFAAGGSARADLEREVAARGFSNAVFLPAPLRKQMPPVISAADFCLAFVKSGPFSRWLLSSKVFMYMSCGRPVFAAAVGETARVIQEAQAGIVEDATSEGIARLAQSIGRVGRGLEIEHMGANGRRYAEHYCSWDALATSYERVLQSVHSPRRDFHQIKAQEAPEPGAASSAQASAKQL